MSASLSAAVVEGAPRLSICIATRNRCAYLEQTLASALAQCDARVEIVVVDGASDDDTPAVMARLCASDPRLRYFREASNGGIDQDYDKAVGYAQGEYCWLMSDDDWFLPGALARVLKATDAAPSLVVVDAEVRDAVQAEILLARRLELPADTTFAPEELEALFCATARQLSFIGSAIVHRALWLARERSAYYGSFFIHVGVIFQQPLPAPAVVLTTPCLAIRYGNASWTARAFEIWICRWPQLVWSLPSVSVAAKRSVTQERPYESLREIVLLRAKGAYDWAGYRRWVAPGPSTTTRKLLCAAVARAPGSVINLLSIAYVLAFSRARRFALVDLLDSPYFPFKFLRRSPQPRT